MSADAPGMYVVDMAPEGARDPTTWFAGTRLGKRYVSYYLMPINFARVDERLLAELETLTAAGFGATGGDPSWGAAQRGAH